MKKSVKIKLQLKTALSKCANNIVECKKGTIFKQFYPLVCNPDLLNKSLYKEEIIKLLSLTLNEETLEEVREWKKYELCTLLSQADFDSSFKEELKTVRQLLGISKFDVREIFARAALLSDTMSPRKLKKYIENEISTYRTSESSSPEILRAVSLVLAFISMGRRKVPSMTPVQRDPDFCDIHSVACKGNMGYPRSLMPQLSSSNICALGAGCDDGVVDFLADSVGACDTEGACQLTKIGADKLTPTQSEINLTKSHAIAGAILKESLLTGKMPNFMADPIIISEEIKEKEGDPEHHILDGHHRWSSLATLKEEHAKNNLREFALEQAEIAQESKYPWDQTVVKEILNDYAIFDNYTVPDLNVIPIDMPMKDLYDVIFTFDKLNPNEDF